MKNARVAPLWRRVPSDLKDRLEQSVQAAVADARGPGHIYFRADDIAVPGSRFQQLIKIFSRRQTPLNLAVVPAWLTRARWEALKGLGAKAPPLWCWHQHGWRHANHEIRGKKQEFGPARLRTGLIDDLNKGRRRLEGVMGGAFYPVFTPPWNRCDARTLEGLAANGYLGVSRSRASRPAPPPGLADLSVNTDLHTRREPNPADGWQGLLAELEAAIRNGVCGVMIHHQRMNPAAFQFLDDLLSVLEKQKKTVRVVGFKELIEA